MKTFLAFLLCLAALSFTSVAYAGPKEEALAAYDKGDFKKAIKLFLPLANKGDAVAQFKLGVMQNEEWRRDTYDPKKAIDWYHQAADQGLADAQFNLGFEYAKANNAAEAAIWYQKAADQGLADAQFNLGMLYNTGAGVPQNMPQAMVWYQKASDQGFTLAQQALSEIKHAEEKAQAKAQADLLRLEQAKEQEKADEKKLVIARAELSKIRKAADQGDPVAQNRLGVIYEMNRGPLQDDQLAVKWLLKIVDQDVSEAAKLYRKAADQGLATAQFNLGTMYLNGINFEADFGEAMNWFIKAARGGERNAQYHVGMAYLKGVGRPLDPDQAEKWLRLSAAADVTMAQEQLRLLEISPERLEANNDDKECKAFGAKLGSEAYVQCRISLKGLRQKAAEAQAQGAQERALADQQRRAAEQRANQEAALQREAAAAQQEALGRQKQEDNDTTMALMLLGFLDGYNGARAATNGTQTYMMNGRMVTCIPAGRITDCF